MACPGDDGVTRYYITNIRFEIIIKHDENEMNISKLNQ